MKKQLFIALTTVLAMSCGESKKEESQAELFARIDTEIQQNAKGYSTLKEASETIGHRLTGSENGAKAEEYTYNKFKEYGFEDVEYQTFEVEAWSRGTVSVSINDEAVKAVTLGHSPVEANVTGEIVDMGNGLEADYAANPDAATDKIALVYISILEGSPEGLTNLHRSEKTALAIKYGAKGIIIINQVDNGVLLTGTASVTGELIPIPAVCIGKEDGMALKETLKEGTASATIEMTNNSDMIKARNVVATLPGSEIPDEIIVIGGHLDSWDLATGAIDNGIGSFAVLDIARAFKANNLQPKRTVKFVMFMGEEQGLFGSRHMVAEALKEGKMEQIKYMMNLDMAGNPIGMNAGGKLDNEAFFTELGAAIQQQDSIYKNEFSNRSGLHSDHQPFMLEGVPILSVHSNLDRSIYGCYHSDCDDFNLVNEEHMTNTSRFGTMMLYGLANAETLPATKMDSETTKEFMIKNNLKEKLIIGGDWKWDE
ncbi:M20/M25/M40 family metallo-hydrolase [Maribacter sp. PR1]|uniref:Carboxypeptidase Q n=1 Tax=Maribacter cobaltidurans TaxID=1178778 RepID=A0ABU7J104_9FLAO|nr:MULTISPECIES: M20/M25/M40 family metallo-hydrolase [Maribacter]MDC6391044.1 M20/M25/M40 family metallo-hydrolase [Maribacter sp. PR1]MEE1978436.1 M20/M25/M40 family metallo-hydrolase [Maribacter cobaltidurans]